MISAEERQKNETVYRMSWAVVRNLYLHGEISGKVAERLNRKNAEKTGNIQWQIRFDKSVGLR